jgi:hypothetical protein
VPGFSPLPQPAYQSETGLTDQTWINEVRRELQDTPQDYRDTGTTDGVSGVAAAGSQPYQTSKKPISDAPGDFSVTVAGVVYPVDTSNPPATGKVYVNYDLGEIYFASAPATGQALSVFYKRVNWTDQTIGQALYAGLHRMFPTVGKTYTDITIPIQVNVWDYPLPPRLAEPRSRIKWVEIIDPFISTEPYRFLDNWRKVGDGMLHIPESQSYAPTAQLRIVGWGRYLTLGDLEPELYDLPKWYAKGMLLADDEARRLRAVAQPTQGDSQRPPLMHIQAGAFFMQQFNQQLQALRRTPSARIRLVPSGRLRARV